MSTLGIHTLLLFLLLGLMGSSIIADNPSLSRAPAAGSQVVSQQTKLVQPDPGYLLGTNDEIVIRCLDGEEFTDKPLRIGDDGTLSLPFVGRVKASGLTLAQFEADLHERLQVFMNNPQLTVNIAEFRSQPITVTGAVNNPGVHQLAGRKTVLEMISLAGGLARDAGNELKLIRKVQWGPIPLESAREDLSRDYTVAELDLKSLMSGSNPAQNIDVRPNDVISVPRADLVYVIGEVHKPGGFALTDRKNVTVLQAISMSEGLQHTALGRKAKIFRRSSDAAHRTEISVNLDEVLRGRAQDMLMMADDILFVPDNKAKSVAMRTIEAIVQAGTGVIIYRR